MNSIPESEKDTKNPDSPILYRPKPKRLCISYNQVINKNSHKKHFALSPTANEPKNKKPKLNFDEISLKEIERDFKVLKARSEIIEVENELLSLLRNSTKENSLEEDLKDNIKIKRPKNPFLKNLE